MFPTLYSSDMVSIHAWGLMVLLAFAVACGVAGWRAPRVGIDPDKLVPLYVLVGVAGMLGARLLHFVFAEPDLFFTNPLGFFDAEHGGWAFYGGVIGGVGAGAVYARVRDVAVWKLADIAAASIMLGLAVGRIGCVLAGCCHGGVCDAPVLGDLLVMPYGEVKLVDGFPHVALRFEPGVGVGALRGRVLFPTQLMEVGSGLLWFGLLSAMWRWGRRFDGQVLAAMMVLYAGSRTWVEGFRGDTIRGLYDVAGVQLSTSRLVAIGMAVGALAIVALRFSRGVAPEVPFEPEDEEV
ncbi:MAG: prolipoprotein diacylglyceryl transferase family protein [Myxococcota bacterium]|nr:prolipoprotein diacylglyceryl transferase family protein [Myxococcota bacterium]